MNKIVSVLTVSKHSFKHFHDSLKGVAETPIYSLMRMFSTSAPHRMFFTQFSFNFLHFAQK